MRSDNKLQKEKKQFQVESLNENIEQTREQVVVLIKKMGVDASGYVDEARRIAVSANSNFLS